MSISRGGSSEQPLVAGPHGDLRARSEVQLGQDINNQLLSGGQVRLYRNQQINNYVNEIGQRLVPNSERPDIPYTFQVVADECT